MYKSLERLNYPPKPHAFMALPAQSGFFSTQFRFIKENLNETLFYTIFLLFFIYIAYRLPTKFMLNELGLLVYFPLFNIVYTLCCAICIAHVRKKELTKTRLVFIGFFGLSVPFMFILFGGYYYELHLHVYLTLASLVALLEPLTIFQSTRSPNTPGLGGSRSGSGSGSRSGYYEPSSGQSAANSCVYCASNAGITNYISFGKHCGTCGHASNSSGRPLQRRTYNLNGYGWQPADWVKEKDGFKRAEDGTWVSKEESGNESDLPPHVRVQTSSSGANSGATSQRRGQTISTRPTPSTSTRPAPSTSKPSYKYEEDDFPALGSSSNKGKGKSSGK